MFLLKDSLDISSAYASNNKHPGSSSTADQRFSYCHLPKQVELSSTVQKKINMLSKKGRSTLPVATDDAELY